MAPKNPKSVASEPTAKETGKRTAKKQPIPVPERIKRLFTSLCAQIDGGHFNNAVKTCDKILRLEPRDEDALQTKLFLLLQTEQYTTALSLIGRTDQYVFERAYSLYRLQREPEARDLLDVIKAEKATEENRGGTHLAAQLNYRQSSYQAAFDLYNQLLDTAEPHSDEHSDILINLQASQKHLDFITTNFSHALDKLPTSLTSTLESTTPPPPPSTSAAVNLVTLSPVRTEESHNSINNVRTVRKSRVPADVIPGVTPPPDPERWLKKSERSTFTQAKRRRKAGVGGATQGSVSVEIASTGGPTNHGPKNVSGKSKKKK